jgi:hypothetical protein
MSAPRDLFAWFLSLPKAERDRIRIETYSKLRADPKLSAKAQDIVEGHLIRPKAAVCPIIREIKDQPEQFGSGVLLQIAGVKFLCTAAHVADEESAGPLFIPGKAGFIQITGYYGGMRMPASGKRDDDLYDIGYYRLDEDCVADLHAEFLFLDWQDCDLRDATSARDWYTIIGYPSRQSRTQGNTVETSQLSLSGEGIVDSRYKKLGRNIQHHLLIQFRCKRAMHYQNWNSSPTCLPEGMSGGGVFAWLKKMSRVEDLSQPKLVGVVTDYDESHHVFAATRLNCYINAIRKNNPDLPISVGPAHQHGAAPTSDP